MSHSELSKALGISRTSIARYLRQGMSKDDLLAAKEWVAARKVRLAEQARKAAKTRDFAAALGMGWSNIYQYIHLGMPIDNKEDAAIWLINYRGKQLKARKGGSQPKASTYSPYRAEVTKTLAEREILATALKLTPETVRRLQVLGMPKDLEGAKLWRAANLRPKNKPITVVPMERGRKYPNTTPPAILDAIANVKEGIKLGESLAVLSAHVYATAVHAARTLLPKHLLTEFLAAELARLVYRAALKYNPNKVHFRGMVATNVKWEAIRFTVKDRRQAEYFTTQPFPEHFDPVAPPDTEFPLIEEMGENFARLPSHLKLFLTQFFSVGSDADTYLARYGGTEKALKLKLEEVRFRLYNP